MGKRAKCSICNGYSSSKTVDEERKQLINKLHSMGVMDIHGKNPYTMTIDELKALCNWVENYRSKEKVKS